jgi:diphthamide synthase (EF-2-diphthine--ammonia ligase)
LVLDCPLFKKPLNVGINTIDWDSKNESGYVTVEEKS